MTRMADKTLFERIRDREIPAEMVYEDNLCLAFRDCLARVAWPVSPRPGRPMPRWGMAVDGDEALLGRLLLAAGRIARAEGVAESGYRLVINHGPDGGEAVPHLHVHLLAGRKMLWPPG